MILVMFAVIKMSKYRGHRINLVIPFKEYEEIKAIADQENRPVANLCTAVILQWLQSRDKPI
jgi:CopG-like RHH_1 or ribbon-helix-helix domain, RHH_5